MYVNLSSDSGIFKLINIVGENIALDIIFLIEQSYASDITRLIDIEQNPLIVESRPAKSSVVNFHAFLDHPCLRQGITKLLFIFGCPRQRDVP